MKYTLFDKVWSDHVVTQQDNGADLLHIDRIFLHERTGSAALASIEEGERKIKNPAHVFCTMDHIVDTFPGRTDQTTMPGGSEFIKVTRDLSLKGNITLFDLGDERQGISHVVSPEQGIALPGCTVICPDSHTCTLGGLGALATGVGSSECEHALVTETLRFSKPKQMRVVFAGQLKSGVSAKDMILHLIAAYSAAGGSGYAIEFAGPAVDSLTVEARLTLCNMAVEFSAFTGIIAPDDKVFEYLKGRPYAPSGESWQQAKEYWGTLSTDDGAHFDQEIVIDCATISPTVTWGTSPQEAISVDGQVPSLVPENGDARRSMEQSLAYMGLKPGQSIQGLPIQVAFIGSCTNSRLSDLRIAAAILKGRKVASGVRAICVPGSTQVKQAAEKEGLDQIFLNAGFEWRESGCSMCFYAGGEGFVSGERVITSTNRNFEGRQGPGCRSHLASPATVAASAINGAITDSRKMGAL